MIHNRNKLFVIGVLACLCSCQRILPEEMTEVVLSRCLTPSSLGTSIENDFDVKFSWIAMKDADVYNLVIAIDEECTQVVKTVSVPADEVPYMVTLEPGTYYFKVQATAEDRDPSNWTYCTKPVKVTKPLVTIDLSEKETANCYIVSEGGKYKFKATKGCKSDLIDAIASIGIVWETSVETEGTALESQSVISQLSYSNGYVEFLTPIPLKPGNALLAAKDKDGNILWSWHIWATEDKIQDVVVDEGLILLDRNIGELSSSARTSLLYQWGRKDPFPGMDGNGKKVTVAGTATTYVNTTKSVADATKTPTVLYGNVSTNGAEPYALKDGDTYFWGHYQDGLKTEYDPCPAGYKVSKSVADPEKKQSDYNDLNITRYTALSALTFQDNAYQATLANGSKISFSCTGYYLINTDAAGKAASELVFAEKTSVFWTSLLGNKRQGSCVRIDETGTKFWWYTGDKAAKYHAKNNAYPVRCEKMGE